MRWLLRGVVILLGLLVLLLLGGWLYARFYVGAVVNAPVTAVLSSTFPSVFPPPSADAAALAEHLTLPPGLALTVFARNVPDARMLRTTHNGDLLLASPGKGAIFLLRADRDGDGASDGVSLLMRGLDGPNGLDFHGQYLYVAEQGRVGRIAFDHLRGRVSGTYEVVIDRLPTGGNHWKKTLRFGPDGMLYVAIGSSCNVCVEEDPRRAAMMRFAPDGSGGKVIATGLRNSAGFDWRPQDAALYATDNGRDLLGDDFPPCELNRIVEGGFYGWPYVNGMGVADPDLGAGHDAERARALSPAFAFNAHNAPLGILFPRRTMAGGAAGLPASSAPSAGLPASTSASAGLPASTSASAGLPASYAGSALVALHGSWNRSDKDGYKVVSLHWQPDGRIVARDFLAGFLVDDTVHGRPAELAEGPDGAIYVSDDFNGAVYRIARAAPGTAAGVRADAGAPAEPDAAMLASLEAKAAAPVAAEAAKATPATAASAAELARDGERLFQGSGCLECHVLGADAAPANGPAKVRLTALAARYDATRLQAYLERPIPPMPPVANAAERAALAHYLLQAAP